MKEMRKDRTWLEHMAEAEADCFVSVGGLVTRLEAPMKVPSAAQSAISVSQRSAFIRLLQLARRQQSLTLEEFSNRARVPMEEMVRVEKDNHFVPTLRTIHNIALYLKIPEKKLMALAGLLLMKDASFNEAAVRFAARSETVQKLTPQEHQALEEYIRFLNER